MKMFITKDNNFIGLLIGQLILIFTMPMLPYFSEITGKHILHTAFIGMILLTIIGNRKNSAWYKSIMILTIIEIIILVIAAIYENIVLTYIAISLSLFFLVTSIVVAFKGVFNSKVITLNQLVGASCIYLLLGMIGAILYSNLFFIAPDSFSGLSEKDIKLHFPEFMYYSYVTLTTLGFGDIIPLSPIAKTMSFMQAIVGQLYLTIMVAGLVGKAISSSNHKE
jgi:voltage-gated potassium channel